MVASITRFQDRIHTQDGRSTFDAWMPHVEEMHAVATLAGGIAHQFNNTLVGIAGNIDLLKLDLPDNPVVDKYVASMRAALRKMVHMTDQLLAYARGGDYCPSLIPFNEFLDGYLNRMEFHLYPFIDLERNLSSDVMPVKADPDQLEMVISVLIENAIESIQGSGSIRITTRNEQYLESPAGTHGSKKEQFICLTVEDTGRGMDEETLKRIFDPFFTTKLMGRGLGMAAVYGIVKNHGGWLTVDSEEGMGTVVRLYLPSADGGESPEQRKVEAVRT